MRVPMHVRPRMTACVPVRMPVRVPVLVPHPSYMQGVRALCDKHGILYIADEVMVGFGRTGKLWAFQHYDGVVPDLVVPPRPSIMISFTQHNPSVCLTMDDLEGLNGAPRPTLSTMPPMALPLHGHVHKHVTCTCTCTTMLPMRCNAIICNAIQYHLMQQKHNTSQYKTRQDKTGQHRTRQDNTQSTT